jgi:hypothetical protein
MKQKQQIIVLVVLVVVAALVWTFELRQQTPSTITATFIQDYKVLAVENPQIHWGQLKRAQETEYKSNGRNPFSVIAPPTAAEVKQKADDAAKLQAQQPVTPVQPAAPTKAFMPPNLKYFGYGTVPNGTPRRAFFTDGEDTYIVTEGDTLLGRYRILKVGNANLEFEEISSGLRGTTPLEEQQPATGPSA